MYFGAFGYADDLGLIAPCREALQKMIDICKEFFDSHGIQVSTNPDVKKTKTKIITFGVKTQPVNIVLGDIPLPYVSSWPHLGHIICSDESPVHDLEDRKHVLIGKIHSLRQELSDLDPVVYVKLIRLYLLHLYGCTLWDIFSNEAVQLWTMWHVTIKSLFKLPPPTHRYLLNHLVSCDHVKKIIIKRFMKFRDTIASSSIPQIKLLHRVQCCDWRSTYGRNCMHILREAQATDMTQVTMEKIQVNPVPQGEEWRLDLLKDLLAERDTNSGFLTSMELQLLIDEVCNN